MISIFAKFKNLPFLDVRLTILRHLKNTLTDRVAVLIIVWYNICSYKWMLSCALELNCNVHPLDGIAKKCTNIFKSYDAEMAIKSDTSCCKFNLWNHENEI